MKAQADKMKSKLKIVVFTLTLLATQWVMASPQDGGDTKPSTIIAAIIGIVMGVFTLILTGVLAWEGTHIVINKEFSLKKIGVIAAGTILVAGSGYLAGVCIGKAF